MTKKVVKKSKRSKLSTDDSNLMRGTARTRSGEDIGEETQQPKIRCLSLCSVDSLDNEVKLVENDPTFVVTLGKF